MYAKAYDDKEIHDCDEFYKNFPDKNNYDYSNKESNQRNYIKVKVNYKDMGYSKEELQKLIQDAEANRDSKKHKKAVLPKYKYRGKEQE